MNLNIISFLLTFLNHLTYSENIIPSYNFKDFNYHGINIKICTIPSFQEYVINLKKTLLIYLNNFELNYMKIEIFKNNELKYFYLIDFNKYLNFLKIMNENENIDYLKFDFQIKNLLNDLIENNKLNNEENKNFKIKFGINENNNLNDKKPIKFNENNFFLIKIFEFEDFLLKFEKYIKQN